MAAAAPYTPSPTGVYGTGKPTQAFTPPDNLFLGLGTSALTAPGSLAQQGFTPKALDQGKLTEYQQLLDAEKYLSGDQSYLSNGQKVGDLWNQGKDIDTLWQMGNNTQDAGNLQKYHDLFKQYGMGPTFKGQLGQDTQKLLDQFKPTQNTNLAGWEATNSANAKNAGYLQQAAIAQNRLLGQLNSRGLLQSYENGGAGTADMNLLQQALNSAANDQGIGLQNELNGLNSNDALYQMQLSNYNNQMGNYSRERKSQGGGLTDILGLGLSALPMIAGL